MISDAVHPYRFSRIKKSFYFIELYILYFIIALHLRHQGLKKSVALCTKLHRRKRTLDAKATEQFVLLIRDLTHSVLRWHLLPTSCVPDSLLPCWFLARRGIKADFVIIVRHYPFMAHAQAFWNEMLLTNPPPELSVPGKYVTLMRK